MSEAPITAFVAHTSRGRLRLRIPAKRGDAAYFARLVAEFARCPGIVGAEGTARSGSLVLRHTLSLADIGAAAEQLGLFHLATAPIPPRQTLLQHAGKGLDSVDRQLLRASHGLFDLSSAVFLGLVTLAVRQTVRGNILIPSTSLLWYSLGLIHQAKTKPR